MATVGLWVVFLETDCKINAKIKHILTQNFPKLYPNFSTIPHHSKIPLNTRLSTTLSTAINPNRIFQSQTPYYYAFPNYRLSELLRISEIVYITSKTLPQSPNPIPRPKTPRFTPLLQASPSKFLLPSIPTAPGGTSNYPETEFLRYGIRGICPKSPLPSSR